VNTAILYALRIGPSHFNFRAHYRPQAPLSIREWQEELPDAALIVNANFFDIDNTILGLLISDGIVFGQAYSDRGGTFFVQEGNVGIRSNLVQPYKGEAFEQAIQAFPILVFDGIQSYTDTRDIIPSRRTVIAQDSEGRIIVLITSTLGISLYDLSAFLANSDMNILNALNLDGGASSMSYVAATDNFILSFDPVPAVLAIYPK
jgi:exopolysaccharide biosynthesis protein